MLVGSGGVSGIGALHRQAVARERGGGLGGDEVFENLAARLLLWLGQGHAHSIFALVQNTKCPVGQPLLAVPLCRAAMVRVRQELLSYGNPSHNRTDLISEGELTMKLLSLPAKAKTQPGKLL